MSSFSFFQLILLVQLGTWVIIRAEQEGKDVYSSEQCLQLGFDRNVLQCEKCKEFSKFDLDELESDCGRCCTQTVGLDQQKRYPKARLEMCNCKLGYYPQIQAFMKSSRPKKFQGLTIKHIPGGEPIIKLLDENDTVQEKLSIQKWDTDTIEEFLKERLL